MDQLSPPSKFLSRLYDLKRWVFMVKKDSVTLQDKVQAKSLEPSYL
jgi:hypothetical protein